MHIANLEAGAFAREPAGTQRRETPLEADLGQGIRLLHELGELAATKELAHRRHHGANVDQGIGRRLAWLLDAHALLYDALHAQQADTKLGLDQFPDATHPAIAQVIDVVFTSVPIVQRDEAAHDIDKIIQGQDTVTLRNRQVKLFIELIATYAAEVVAATIEEQVLDEGARIINSGRVARTQLFIDFQQGLVFALHRVAFQSRLDIANGCIVIDSRKRGEHALVR